MPRPATKKSDVIDAALFLFRQKGIRATTTRDIALRAGISEGTIYTYFHSKKELAEVLFEENLDAFWRFLKHRLKNAGDAEEMLLAFVSGFFEFARREQKSYGFIIAAHQTELRKLSREKMKPKHMLRKIIRLGQMQGKFRKIDPNLASAMLMGTITQTIFYLRSGRIAVNYDNVVAEVNATCIDMMRKGD